MSTENEVKVKGQDGLVWIKTYTPGSLGVHYWNGLYVTLGCGANTILTSPDANTWTPRTLTYANWLNDVTFGGGLYVMTGTGGQLFTSPDAINWTRRASPIGYDLIDAAYGNNTWVVLGYWTFGQVITSTDGITWTQRDTGARDYFGRVAFGDGKFVAGVRGNKTVTSTNGVSWTMNKVKGISNFDSITCYENGRFYGSTTTGIASSVDGITWAGKDFDIVPPVGVGLAAVHGNTLICVGGYGQPRGALLVSYDGGTHWRDESSKVKNEVLFGACFGTCFTLAGTFLWSEQRWQAQCGAFSPCKKNSQMQGV